jgi:uncharacterized protein (TIGR02246 family)
MPARTPQEIHEQFTQAFSARDTEALLALYEPGAVFIPQPGLVVSGPATIREALGGFLALDATFEMHDTHVIQADDIAYVSSKWTLKGSDPSGAPVDLAGQTADVARRQADGTWLMVIDNPYGV